ncbi:MAG: flippase-like domain-containing protein [Planctomycetaceae bacterium]|nr:flippase-like domain-containing protein [Planctomycetaceae bacterium]
MHRLSKLWRWLKWPAALGVLAWLYWSNQHALEQIAGAPKSWGYLAAAVALIAGSTLLTFLRWYLLVRAQQFPFRVRDALRLGFLGLLSNYVAPGSVGGDIVKAALLAHEQASRRTVAVATVLLDRILGLLALFMVGATASLLPLDIPESPQLQTCTLLLWIGSLSGLTGVGLMLFPGTTRWRWVNALSRLPVVGRLIGELIQGVTLYQSQPLVLLKALVLSLIGHAGLIGGFYCCALWMQQPWIPTLTMHFYFMPNAELFGVIIPAPGGVGPLEAAIQWFYDLLRPQSVDADQAKAAGLMAALAFRVVTAGIAAIGGAYYVSSRREIAAALREAEEAPA